MDSSTSREEALSELPSSSSRNRGQMPQIPEEQEEYSRRGHAPVWSLGRSSLPMCTCDQSPFTSYNFNRTNLPNTAYNTQNAYVTRYNRNRRIRNHSLSSHLKFLSEANELSTDFGIDMTMFKDPEPPVETVRPLEAYVKETDKLIKKLLAEIAEREMDTS